jgi:hypothetical protein
MVRSTYKKGVLAALASVALFLGLVGAPPAQAASTDPILVAYSDATFVVENSEYRVTDVLVGPTTAYTNPVTPTYFSSEANAASVSMALIGGDGLTISMVLNFPVGSGTEWTTKSTVTLPRNETYGAASIRYCNQYATGGTCPPTSIWDTNATNISVVRLAPTTVASVDDITVVVDLPSGTDPDPFTDETIPSAAFDEEEWGTNYPTGLDAIAKMASTASTDVTDAVGTWKPGFGYQLTSLTVDGTTYDDSTGYWSYSVQGSAIANVVGADVYRLFENNVVTWTFTLK